MTILRWLRRAWPALLAGVVLIIAAALIWAWRTPSGYFILWPDKAHPTDVYLHIPGGEQPAAGTGFYFVDVHELDANKLEELWGRYLVHGASLIPDREVVLPGESEQQRVKEDFQAMDTSQVVAEAVAEKALGRDVTIRHLGALIEQVSPGLPAAKAGVEAGDVVTAIDGHPVQSAADLVSLTKPLKPGDTASYTFSRIGTKRLRTVASTAGPRRAIIGVAVGDDVRIGRIPVKVKYTISGIGGPSAGLAFALEIYDSLSGRHLLRGHRIAATGELDPLGDVIEIGGAEQKALGAIEAGADTFIVPTANAAAARKAADGKLRVIGVNTFSQALRAIRSLAPRKPS
ncbi:MAG TPA: PDZ domain-containing protein [Gaiellales bacterium]|jgi:PDZ domain-containing protein